MAFQKNQSAQAPVNHHSVAVITEQRLRHSPVRREVHVLCCRLPRARCSICRRNGHTTSGKNPATGTEVTVCSLGTRLLSNIAPSWCQVTRWNYSQSRRVSDGVGWRGVSGAACEGLRRDICCHRARPQRAAGNQYETRANMQWLLDRCLTLRLRLLKPRTLRPFKSAFDATATPTYALISTARTDNIRPSVAAT